MPEHRQQGLVLRKWPKEGWGRLQCGALYYLLHNPLYVGRIAHRGATYDGQHPAIVPLELWDRVQTMLTQNQQGKPRTARAAVSCLLSADR